MNWELSESDNKLAEIVAQCHINGPQIITENSKPTAVMMAFNEYQRLLKKITSLSQHS